MERKQVLAIVLKFGFVLAEQNCKAFFHEINMVYEGRTTDSRTPLWLVLIQYTSQTWHLAAEVLILALDYFSRF
jgi:hypothetical protein